MYLIGDIGNTEIKICLIDSNLRLFKTIRFSTISLSKGLLDKKLKIIKRYKKKIKKILFCSVVPKAFKFIKLYLKKIVKIQCLELKKCKLDDMLKIDVNKKQIGSDRLANAISVINNKNNFIVIDFGTATNFDVVIKNRYIGGVLAPGIQLSLNNL